MHEKHKHHPGSAQNPIEVMVDAQKAELQREYEEWEDAFDPEPPRRRKKGKGDRDGED